MRLEPFGELIKVIQKTEAKNLRKRYIQKFVNTSIEYYEKYIKVLNEYADGFCYSGYLWDCFKDPKVIDPHYIQSQNNRLRDVYVFWDIHSKEKIFIEDYWEFGKDSVLLLDFNLLLNNLEHLPEDIYIFDNSLEWTLVLTHEYIGDKRWCLKSGNI